MLPKRAHGNQGSPFEYMFWRKPLAPFQLPDAEDEDEKMILDNLDSDAESEQEGIQQKKSFSREYPSLLFLEMRALISLKNRSPLCWFYLIVSRPNRKLIMIRDSLEKQIHLK